MARVSVLLADGYHLQIENLIIFEIVEETMPTGFNDLDA